MDDIPKIERGSDDSSRPEEPLLGVKKIFEKSFKARIWFIIGIGRFESINDSSNRVLGKFFQVSSSSFYLL